MSTTKKNELIAANKRISELEGAKAELRGALQAVMDQMPDCTCRPGDVYTRCVLHSNWDQPVVDAARKTLVAHGGEI